MKMSTCKFLLYTVILPSSLTACGSGAGQPAQIVPVKGKVTYKGHSLSRGIVRFRPVNSGRTATGQIQPDGTFSLATFKEGDGAAVGLNRVSISGTGPGTKEIVPRKYLQPLTSKLEADVSPEKTEFNFELQ
jgi:hypothetical protein